MKRTLVVITVGIALLAIASCDNKKNINIENNLVNASDNLGNLTKEFLEGFEEEFSGEKKHVREKKIEFIKYFGGETDKIFKEAPIGVKDNIKKEKENNKVSLNSTMYYGQNNKMTLKSSIDIKKSSGEGIIAIGTDLNDISKITWTKEFEKILKSFLSDNNIQEIEGKLEELKGDFGSKDSIKMELLRKDRGTVYLKYGRYNKGKEVLNEYVEIEYIFEKEF